MKTKLFFIIATTATLLLFPCKNFGQAPDLGSTVNFILFTITGAVDNTGISPIRGHVGSNDGDISGYNNVQGNIYIENAVTAQCSTDLVSLYTQLNSTIPTSTTHTPAFGSGETLLAGVYSIAAAGSIAGTLTLDAQGNNNALFIFKFGGAFSTGASSTVALINGASACNVFWVAEGAISMAASTTMKGTLVSHNGAISIGDGGLLEGRMFSTTGAVSTYNLNAPVLPCSVLPVKLLSFTASCDKNDVLLKWSTAIESNNDYFTVERSINGINWQVAGKVPGSPSSSDLKTYSLRDDLAGIALTYYRLKQTDLDGNYKYGNIVSIKKCGNAAVESLKAYPNPSAGNFDLLFTGIKSQVQSTKIYNAQGAKVYESCGFQQAVDLSGKTSGVYFVQLHLNSEIIIRKVVVEK